MTTAINLPYIGKMKTDAEIFSTWLKKVVKFEGQIKGKDLAKKINVHPSTISGWFGEKSQGPRKELSLKICEILHGDYSEIIKAGRHKEDEPNPEHPSPTEKNGKAEIITCIKELSDMKLKFEMSQKIVAMLESENERLKAENMELKRLAAKPLGGEGLSQTQNSA